MVKENLGATVDKTVLKWIQEYRKKTYPGLSFSAVVELLLREAMRQHQQQDLSIVH